MHPLAVHEELVLVLALRQVDDGDKVPVAAEEDGMTDGKPTGRSRDLPLDHRYGLPIGKGARDVHLFAAAVPLEDRGEDLVGHGLVVAPRRVALRVLRSSPELPGSQRMTGHLKSLQTIVRCVHNL